MTANVSTVADVVAAQLRVADATAASVTCNGVGLSWAELDALAESVALQLTRPATGPGGFVPVIAARGAPLVAAWLGTLRAGRAYVPLSPDTPAGRLEYILREVDARTVLVDATGAQLVENAGIGVDLIAIEGLDAVPSHRREGVVPVSGHDPAVVIYTSGTTGRPKGVIVSQRGLLNTVLWWASDSDLTPDDRVLCTWSTSFDGATFDTFRSLVSGSQLLFADDVERRDPRALLRLVRGPQGATVTSMTPSLLRAMLDADDGGSTTLRLLYVGGESLSRSLAAECVRRWDVPMRNVYGPTEASCISTYAAVDLNDHRSPPIGVPLPNTRAYVLGPNREELPIGVPGELYVAGAGVALGYLGRPDLTEAAFPQDPYADDSGSRMYRTGDRVLLRDDGLLECLGRIDDQVKILGNRIEPGEVRRLLEEHPLVRSAAVQAAGAPRRLVAYVELISAERPPTHDDLLRPLLRWLPPAVIPSEVYVVDALPLTSNDKIDFAALREMTLERLPKAAHDPVELTKYQERAAELFVRALAEVERDQEAPALPDLGPNSDFFTLGGHSLLSVQMLADAERRWGSAISLRDFLADPTVAGLAGVLEAASEPAGVASSTTTKEEIEVSDRYPATSTQQRFWLIDRMPTLRSAYLAPVLIEVTGALDRDALRHAVDVVLGRHPSLRSRFELDVKRRQVFYRTGGPRPVVSTVDAEQHGWGPSELAQYVDDLCWTPFDLAHDVPARAGIVFAGERTLVILTTHHIVTDGWSVRVLLEQISESYRALVEEREPRLADPVHPADLARASEGPPADTQVAEVVSRLTGAPTDVKLPHDRPRAGVQATDAATCSVSLGADLTTRLRGLAADLGCTSFMLTAALLAGALSRSSAQRDFLFAFPWAGREVAGAGNAVGLLVNTLVLRVDGRNGPTWRELLARVRAECMACYRNPDVPFDALAAQLHPERDLSKPALTPVFVSAAFAPPPPLDLGPQLEARYGQHHSLRLKYELELTATESATDLELVATYAAHLFDEATMRSLLAEMVACASDLVTDPDTPALGRAEVGAGIQ